jgi:hypothetical protein
VTSEWSVAALDQQVAAAVAQTEGVAFLLLALSRAEAGVLQHRRLLFAAAVAAAAANFSLHASASRKHNNILRTPRLVALEAALLAEAEEQLVASALRRLETARNPLLVLLRHDQVVVMTDCQNLEATFCLAGYSLMPFYQLHEQASACHFGNPHLRSRREPSPPQTRPNLRHHSSPHETDSSQRLLHCPSNLLRLIQDVCTECTEIPQEGTSKRSCCFHLVEPAAEQYSKALAQHSILSR